MLELILIRLEPQKKLNEEVVGAEAGINFLKKEIKLIIDKPINNSKTNLLMPHKGKLNVWLLVGGNGVVQLLL